MKNFGNFLRALRKEKGWNQTQLAAKLNLDSAGLSKIENGRKNLKESLIPLVAEIFDLDVDLVKEKYFSEKIAIEIYQNDVPETVFKTAEQRVKYLKTINFEQRELNF